MLNETQKELLKLTETLLNAIWLTDKLVQDGVAVDFNFNDVYGKGILFVNELRKGAPELDPLTDILAKTLEAFYVIYHDDSPFDDFVNTLDI